MKANFYAFEKNDKKSAEHKRDHKTRGLLKEGNDTVSFVRKKYYYKNLVSVLILSFEYETNF